MQFKQFFNPTNGTRLYFINGERVSSGVWAFQEVYQQMLGKVYNSSYITIRKDGVHIYGHCFN